MAVGGSIEALNLSGRTFPVAADAEAQRKLGGFENEVMANGDGSARIIKTRVPLDLSGVVVQIDDTRGDAEYLQDLMNMTDFFVFDITYASGEVYQGRGQLTGESPTSSQSTTAPVNLMGPGRLERQV